MDNLSNSVLIQGATLEDLEAMINRAVEKRLHKFYESIHPQSTRNIRRKEAATILGKSLPTIDSYSKIGLLHKKHIGGQVYFDEAEVLTLKSR